jgi:hypothetical protein
MKRVIALVTLALIAGPTFAQTADADFKAFVKSYVAVFNKADAAGLATGFYALPETPAAKLQADLTAKFDDLRQNEFGKMEVYSVTTCSVGADGGKIQINYAYTLTYGGVMPPGDQGSVFDMKKTADGWRIVKVADLKAGMKLVCAP